MNYYVTLGMVYEGPKTTRMVYKWCNFQMVYEGLKTLYMVREMENVPHGKPRITKRCHMAQNRRLALLYLYYRDYRD